MTTPNLLSAASLTQGLLNTPALIATGSEVTVYSVPTGKAVKIASAALTNTTNAAVTVSVSVVPSGGAGGAANRVLASYALAAYDTITQEDGLAALKGAMLADGQFITVNAGTNNAVTFAITGTVTA